MREPAVGRTATAIGGRHGSVASDDGALRVLLGRAGASASINSEQLVAAGYAASVLEATRQAALRHRRPLARDSSVTATIQSDPPCVRLNIDLPGLEPGLARLFADEALAACPYSRAISGNAEVVVEVV